jgi:HK97 family phage prohead protease
MFFQTYDREGAGVFMGVEVDKSHRVSAYYLLNYNPGDYGYSGSAGRERVPADQLIHVYLPEARAPAPWLPVAGSVDEIALPAWRFQGFRAHRRARFGGENGLLHQERDMAAPGDYDDVDANGGPVMEVEPGAFEELPFGWDVKTVDWQHPNIQFGEFTKACLRGSAVGMGVGYNTLAGDLEGVNYSSLREGPPREHRPVAQAAALVHRLGVPAGVLPLAGHGAALPGPSESRLGSSRRSAIPGWQARGWQWVDPLKEVQAHQVALALGLTTRAEILASAGARLRRHPRATESRERGRCARWASTRRSRLPGTGAIAAAANNGGSDGEQASEPARQPEGAEHDDRDVQRQRTQFRGSDVPERALARRSRTSPRSSLLDSSSATLPNSRDATASSKPPGWSRCAMSDDRTARLSFSSEIEAQRWFGGEILDHAPSSVRMNFMGGGNAPLLLHHDQRQLVGVVTSAYLGGDRRGYATGSLRERRPGAERARQDVEDGILRNVSVGYRVHKMVLDRQDGDREVYRVTDREPLEASLVSIPVDPTVGVGRSENLDPHAEQATIDTPIQKEERAMTTEIDQAAAPAADTSVTLSGDSARAARDERARIREIQTLAARHNFGRSRR